jgi:hypothetical protein
MLIDPELVHSIFMYCLYRDEEVGGDTPAEKIAYASEHGRIVEGIVTHFAFNPTRLDEKAPVIRELIGNLPSTFDEGWSFLNMCQDRDGELWTGFHQRADELACLGMAIGCMVCCLPREFWSLLPGGVPYYQRIRQRADLTSSN